MGSRTELIGNRCITENYYKNCSKKGENVQDFGALLLAGGGREEQLRAVHEREEQRKASYSREEQAWATRGQMKDAQEAEPQKAEGKETEENADMPKSYREQILEKLAEMAENIKKGTIQPKFQIGAQEFSIEEWKTFLEKFDAAEETLREEVEAQIEELKKLAEMEAMRRAEENGMPDTEKATDVSESTAATVAQGSTEILTETMTEMTTETAAVDAAALLTDEVTKCSYPTDDPKHKHWYITAYGQDGISCKEAYFDGTRWINKDLWSFSYTEKGQYERVMAFLQRFPQDANLRFAAHENFWKDLLVGEIDEEDFAAFFETTKDGVPDYTYEKDGSTYIDRDKIKYAKYMNSFGARFYTAQEMAQMQSEIIRENTKNKRRIDSL
ncbi:MAG: hypothetical protein NC416_11790 [Eubacterium sp.]|nr:hypothetical protein [Eubacterium sp.]